MSAEVHQLLYSSAKRDTILLLEVSDANHHKKHIAIFKCIIKCIISIIFTHYQYALAPYAILIKKDIL